MTLPTVKMTRRVLQLASGDIRYEVTTQVVDRGDLPCVELFVASITDVTSEKTDVLARVVTPFELRELSNGVYIKAAADSVQYVGTDPFVAVADIATLTELARDRTTAVQRGATTYLTSTVTLLYSSVVTATAAYQTLLARLSQLVTDWRTYSTAFATNPAQSYTLPQVGVGVEDQLTAVYASAKRTRGAAEARRDAAQTAKDACAARDASDAAVFALLTADVAFLRQAKLRVQGTTEGGTLVLTGGTTLNAPATYTITPTGAAKAFCVDGGDPQSYEALLVAKAAALETLRVRLAAGAAECAALGQALTDAQAAVATARTAENNALAAVLAVCPTFDPTTVSAT